MKNRKGLSFFGLLLIFSYLVSSCGGPTQSQIEGRLYLFGKVNLQFQTGGKYDAYLSESGEYWDKHSSGQGTWRVENGEIIVGSNNSIDSRIRNLEGVWKINPTSKYLEKGSTSLRPYRDY